MSFRAAWIWLACASGSIGAFGCGEKSAPQALAPVESSGGDEPRREEREDALAISGLRGTLSQEEIKKALDPRMGKFARCVQQRAGELEWLAGGVNIEFRVKVDGSVAFVYPRDSSLGDRATERCVIEVAQATRFPAPHGGEADFAWSFEVPLDGSIREPVSLPDETIQGVLSAQSGSLASSCGGGSYGVTAYVDPDGKVVAAGASAGDEQSAQHLDCVAAAVQAFVFPSPGSYAAKNRFSVP
jgi:hypothetical protein